MKKLVALLLVLVMGLSCCLAGCSNSNEETTTKAPEQTTAAPSGETTTKAPEAPAEPVVFTFGVESEPQGLDGSNYYTNLVQAILNATMEPLVRTHEGAIVPAAAESWEVSEDGLTWTFHLRDDVKWEDGVTLTAKHFEEGWARMLNSDTISSFSGTMNSYFENGVAFYNKECDWEDVGIKALDDTTLELRLANPAGYLLQVLSMSTFAPSRLDFIAQHGEAFGGDADKVISCGPFVVESWEHEARLVLAKNPDWYDADKVKLDKVVYEIVTSADTRAMMFDEGDLDYVKLQSSLIQLYSDNEHFGTVDTGTQTQMLVKLDHKYLKNLNLRKAIGWSFDREDICSSFMYGAATPGLRWVSNVIAGANGFYADEHPEVKAFGPKADVELAKQYMDTFRTEAGLSADQTIELDYLTGESQTLREISEYLQDTLLNVLNIKVDLNLQPSSTRWGEEGAGHYDLDLSGWGPDFNDPLGNLCAFDDSAAYKHTQFSTLDVYDDFLAALRNAGATNDAVQRMAYLAEAEGILMDNVVLIPVIYTSDAYLLRNTFEGISFPASGPGYDYIWASKVA